MFELREDLLMDILKRLPIKPIGQFKCVSKAWLSLLSSPGFIRPHLKFHKDDPKQFIVTTSWSCAFNLDYYIVTLADSETADDGSSEDEASKTADEDPSETAADASETFEDNASETADDATADENSDGTASETADEDASETSEDNASKTADDATADENSDGTASESADEDASETSSDDSIWHGVARKGKFPVEHKFFLAGSCDGLVLLVLQDIECSKILFNPITLETAKVVDDRDLDLISLCTYGFGYDSSSDDYKIVSLSRLAEGNGSLVDVYSVRMKSWKRIANSHYVLQKTCVPVDEDEDERPAPGVFVNGCIHWLGSTTNPPEHGYEIVCFDLAREKFVEVPIALDRVFRLARESFDKIPNPDDRRVQFDISVIDGCLALAVIPADVVNQWWHIHVWVMKEYGVRDSWTQIANMSDSYLKRNFVKIVCGLNEDDIVVAAYRNLLCGYNFKDEWYRRLNIASFPLRFHTILPFRGSLLSPY